MKKGKILLLIMIIAYSPERVNREKKPLLPEKRKKR